VSKPTLISVNAGRPAELDTGRRTLRSAIVKQPLAGPARLRRAGLDGDEQADRENHGGLYKAAYAYAREDQAWWAGELGRDIPPALLGETLTTDGLDVNGAEIGERWRVGAAEVTVSGPRVPCSKLAARMGDPGFVRRFTRAGRPGAYLTVVAEGDVRAGTCAAAGRSTTSATRASSRVFSTECVERRRLEAPRVRPRRPGRSPTLAASCDPPRGPADDIGASSRTPTTYMGENTRLDVTQNGSSGR
jgi:MOSC domain-containing protein YiiM